MEKIARILLPKLREILFIALLLAVILLGPRLFNIDGDLGRHVTIGKYILQSQNIPRQDIFSHTMTGQPLTPHEWLAQVFFALAHEALNLTGVVIGTAIVIAAAFTLLYNDANRRSRAPLLALGLAILAAAASSLHWLARPHVFTFLFLVIWTERLEQIHRGEKVPSWQLPALMLLWVNTHGAFIAGFVVWGAHIVGYVWERWASDNQTSQSAIRPLLIAGFSSLVVTLINPAGWHLWETSLGFIQNRYLVGHTAEYLPPDFHYPGTWPFLAMIALSVLLLARSKKPIHPSHALLLTGWTAMGLYSARNIPLYAIIAAPILSEVIHEKLQYLPRWQRFEHGIKTINDPLRGVLWPIAAIFAIIISVIANPGFATRNQFDPDVFPVQAVDWLKENPQEGKMFNHFTWGGYLLYRLWPEQLVFIDGQTDFYGEALTRQYEQVITLAEGWEEILGKYQVQLVIMPEDSELVRQLESQADWQVIYADSTTVILQRR